MMPAQSAVHPGPGTQSGRTPTAHPADGPSRLAEYARTRDVRLRDELVREHERLVYYLAGRFRPTGPVGTEDLVQVAYIGLIKALDRFEPEAGVNFIAFAAPTIVGMLKHCLRDQCWAVKVPRRTRELAVRLRRLRDNAEQRLGRPPTPAEMAEEAGVEEERILEAMCADTAYHTTTLHAPAGFEGGEPGELLGELLGAEEPAYAALEEREAMRSVLARLPAREREIIEARFFRALSQAQVGAAMGLSQMHVSRLERRALRQMEELLGMDLPGGSSGLEAPSGCLP